jgi:gliding motility-associated-like protein
MGTVGSVTTNTFVDNGAPTNAQSLYYYVITKSGPTGAVSSVPSDTLKTIFLNLISIQGQLDLKITYNNIHQPKLASSSSTFSILKEYPIGTWNVLGTTAKTNYADTISVCSDSINYQISLKDNSGCVSNSKILGGLYYDVSAPDTAQVDSISVMADGSTTLAWRIPRQLDLVKYQIYLYNGTAQTLAIVPGRQNTAYLFTANIATTNSLSLFVAGIDSCNNPGGFDKRPVTMFLKTEYDRCAYATNLSWNHYVNIPKGFLEYRIYYSENGGAFTQVGTTKQNSFVHTGASPSKNLCYFVRVVNLPQTITASSNRSCLFSGQVQAANFVYIKTASVLNSHSTQIKLYLDTTKISNGIDLYKSIDGNTYTSVTFIPYNGKSSYSFKDENLATDKESYYYKAIVRDSCGNPRTVSNISKTIFLKVLEDKEQLFTKHLSWSAYLGFGGGIAGYSVYRIVNDVSNSAPIGYTDRHTTSFTDNLEAEAPQGSKIEYMVQAIEGIENPYNIKEVSNSNTTPIYMEGRLYIPTAFAPAGENKTWRPINYFVDKTDYNVTVFNRWGNKVFEAKDDSSEWDGAGCQADVYVYLVNYKNARGEYQQIKGTIMLIR